MALILNQHTGTSAGKERLGFKSIMIHPHVHFPGHCSRLKSCLALTVLHNLQGERAEHNPAGLRGRNDPLATVQHSYLRRPIIEAADAPGMFLSAHSRL